MKGLLTKDFLTIKKKYGLPRVIMDIAIIIGECLFYFADIVFIKQVSSLIDVHKSL